MTADKVTVADASEAKQLSAPSTAVASDSAPSAEGNAVIKQMRGQSDGNVGDKFGDVQLTGTTDSTRDADMKMMQDLYDKAIPDPKRREIFHDRMEAIRTGDPKTFDAMVAVAEKIGGKPPLDAASAGREIAAVVKVASDEINAKDGSAGVDLGDTEMMTILGGLSGLMLAERANFDPSQMAARTAEMVDAADKVLNPAADGKPDDAHPHGFMTGSDGQKIPMFVHGVMWADNGEPSLSAYSSNAKYDRHKFEITL